MGVLTVMIWYSRFSAVLTHRDPRTQVAADYGQPTNARSMTREDLIQDAIAMVDRAEYQFPWFGNQLMVIGFRANGALSIFCGEDEVYHLNSRRELRRAYVNNELLKAESGKLVALRRMRTESETALVRRRLEPGEQAEVLHQLEQRLTQIDASFASDDYALQREVAASDGGATNRMKQWLLDRGALMVAPTPRVS